jgi:hypothetical protein
MPPRSRAQAESKQGLVITLVLFILLSLGLGVATYYGFAEQSTLDKKVKEAEKNAKTFQDDRDWYKGQAYRLYAAVAPNANVPADDLSVLRDKMDKGTLGQGAKDSEAVKKSMEALDARTGWDATAKKPKTTYEDILSKLANDYNALLKRADDLDKARQAAEATAAAERKKFEDADKEFQAQLARLTEEAKKDRTTNDQALKTLRDEVVRLGQERENDRKTMSDTLLAEKKAAKAKDDQLAAQKKALKERIAEIEQLKQKGNVAPPNWRTDWQIIRMDQRGTNPYINLGSADRVKPQLTFSIHGLGLDGKPRPESKGTLEVVSVLGDHLSQTRITSVKDPNRDPITKGDVLYNGLWNPFLKRHVAVAGLVDLNTGQRDPEAGMASFLRGLERESVVVDAWLDPRDWSIKGSGINSQTDYLILGEGMEFFSDGRERSTEISKKLDKAVKELQDQAAKNGVPVIGLRKYLEMIGYRIPPHLEEPTGVSPIFKPRPDQLPPLSPVRPPEERQGPPPIR